jgi:isopentenyl-diphosphate Delta-isomerase
VPALQRTTWLECVLLEHMAVPELSAEQIDLSCELAGHRLQAPLFITGMTGGTPEAAAINRTLARVADRLGLGFGLGSQRAMLERPELATTYDVRDVAPNVFLAGNLGATQLRAAPIERVRQMLDRIQANALCVHLNAAQEMMQPEGDRDFRGLLEAIGRAVRTLGLPVIVKETGAGLGPRAAKALRHVGVRLLDVAGSGGTSWVGVEVRRSGLEHDPEALAYWDWGIPTAAAIAGLAGLDLTLLGSGGIRTGLDVARALALGAHAAGVAAPVIQAYFRDGEQGCERCLVGLREGLRTAMLLTGATNLAALRTVPRILLEPLRSWLRDQAEARATQP